MPKAAIFKTKLLLFFRAIHLNWLAKLKIEGARAPCLSMLILLLITVEGVHCCAEKC